MCVTSTTDVLLPSVPYFIPMLLDELANFTHLMTGKTVLYGQFDLWLQPELGVPIRALNVHMHAVLLKGEEVEPEPLRPEDGRTHTR